MISHHEANGAYNPDDIFAQLEVEMEWRPDEKTELALAALDHRAGIRKQEGILEIVREVHLRELSEAGTLYRAFERIGAEAGELVQFRPALTAGTGELYFITTQDNHSRRVSVGRVEKRPDEPDRHAPCKGFELNDARLMAAQFRQLEALKADGTLPDLSPTGAFGIADHTTAIIRK